MRKNIKRNLGVPRYEDQAAYMRAYRARKAEGRTENQPKAVTKMMEQLGLSERPAAGSACPICGYVTTGTIGNGRGYGADLLVLDHDHDTGKFRGWICSNCNRTLGWAGDNLEGVMRFVRYLEEEE